MTHKTIETRSLGATGHLRTEDDRAAYLDAALENGDPDVTPSSGKLTDCAP